MGQYRDRGVWVEDAFNLDSWQHPFDPGSINPHRMKDDKSYEMVAAYVGLDGARKPPLKEEDKHEWEAGSRQVIIHALMMLFFSVST